MPILLFVISCMVLLPALLPPAWLHTHEDMRYIFLFDQFKDVVLQGQLYPRWLPELCGGYGYPTFLFYQPGFFYFTLPFSFLPGYPFWTMIFSLAALVLIGAAGAYRLGTEIAGKTAGLFCAVMFLLTPYLYVNLYVRGDLSEMAAMLMTPWPFYFLLRLKNELGSGGPARLSAAGLALSLAAVVVFHPATALFYGPVFAAAALWTAPEDGRAGLRLLGVTACLAALALALTSVYWLPLFVMKKYVNFKMAVSGPYSAELHTVEWAQFFRRDWGFGLSTPDGRDTMSFQLGLPHFILAAAGFFRAWKNRIIGAAFGLYLVLIALMAPWSAVLWEKDSILRFVQFPWRILSVTAALQTVCIAGLFCGPRAGKGKGRALWMAAAILLSGFWYAGQFQADPKRLDAAAELKKFRESKLERFHTLTQTHEYMPATVKTYEIYPRGGSPMVIAEPGVEVRELPGSSIYHPRFETRADAASTAQINQFYLPGWRVNINGKPVPDHELRRELPPEGLLRLALPPGTNTVDARYDGPPHGPIYWAAAFLAVLLLVGVLRKALAR